MNHSAQHEPKAAIQYLWLILMIVEFAILVATSSVGIDLTDEIFYLIWIRDPQAYALSYQPFGYLLHPLYQLAAGSIVAFRVIGTIICLACGATLGWSLARYYGERTARWIWSTSAIALLVYVYGVVTPNYNWLANLGAILLTGSAIHWQRWAAASVRVRWAIVIMASLGSLFAVFGKPLLLVPFALYLPFAAFRLSPSDRTNFLSCAVGGGLATLCIFFALLAPYGGAGNVIANALMSQSLLAPSTGVAALPGRLLATMTSPPKVLIGTAVALSIAIFANAMGKSLFSRVAIGAGLIMTSAFAIRSLHQIWFGDALTSPLGVAMICLSLLSCALAWTNGVALKALRLPIVLTFLPIAIALGTYNSLYFQVGISIVFPLLAMLIIARIRGLRIAEMAAAIFAGAILAVSVRQPYGWPERLFAQRVPTDLGHIDQAMTVGPQTARFAATLRDIAEANDLSGATPVIDLTGAGPGTVLLLGGHQPVLPWITQITPTWANIVWDRMSPRERQEAWIIGPVHPAFLQSEPAEQLSGGGYRLAGRTEFSFWGGDQVIEVWRPATPR